ncbi:siderophore-interacting protein [uncultured Paracoccus sp.]|uniref:siderophore-interacting protein n=1 Tax=uncultured Paracoccus sp. TaxID=189685 RepID=UPI00262D5FA7|nr:siderophore-interacting protein [uncultured Paracoccus sp.]
MRHGAPPQFQAEAALALPFETLDAILRHEAEEHGLTLRSGHGRSTWLEIGGGEFGARQDGTGSLVYARAHSRDWLFTLQEAAVAHLDEHVPGHVLRWTGPEQAGAMPPNFSLARVAGVTRIGARFLRLRLEGSGVERLARDMIHFRIVLPRPDGDTRWPHLSETGQTVWPDDLHRPAYTVSAIDPATGWMETDVFVHEGGRTCGFATDALPGIQVGLIGPGGGGIPRTPHLVIGGDETAYPALSRIIAAQSLQTRIEVHLLGATEDYPFPDHPGRSLHHVPGGEGLLAEALVDADGYWFATEKSRLQPLKRAIHGRLGIAKQNAHLAAYWSEARTGREV